MILLDTSTLIDLLEDCKSVVDIVSRESGGRIAISAVTLGEIKIGFYRLLSKENSEKKQKFDRMLKNNLLIVLPFDEAIANKYAEIQADLLGKGQPLSSFDGVIATTAILNNLFLLTHDKDFKRVKGLKLLFPS